MSDVLVVRLKNKPVIRKDNIIIIDRDIEHAHVVAYSIIKEVGVNPADYNIADSWVIIAKSPEYDDMENIRRIMRGEKGTFTIGGGPVEVKEDSLIIADVEEAFAYYKLVILNK